MKLVIIESPFAGDVERNRSYLSAAIRDCLGRGEAPFASHGFYTYHLDDLIPEERELGIRCGLEWGARADLAAIYTDLGISNGMERAIIRWKVLGIPVEMRTIGW